MQEPGSDEDIASVSPRPKRCAVYSADDAFRHAQFCQLNHGVDFKLVKKVRLQGSLRLRVEEH